MRASISPVDLLTFELQGERYAVDLALVREVLTLGPVTRVPGAPGGVVGAAAVRGRVLAVVDLDLGEGRGAGPPCDAGDEALRLEVPPHELLLRVGKALEVVSADRWGDEERLALPGQQAPARLLDLHRFVARVSRSVAEAANHFQVHPFSIAPRGLNPDSGDM